MNLRKLSPFKYVSCIFNFKFAPCFSSKTLHDTPLNDHSPSFLQDKIPKYEVSKLSNGITVLTESISFPFYTDIGVLLNVGSRDENLETSGSVEAIKSNYLRTANSLDGILNLKTIQTSGASFTMDYDQETMYYRASCLSDYLESMLDIIIDCSLQPKTFLKREKKIKDESLILPEENAETIMTAKINETCFGNEGLGLPIGGIEENADNITNETILKFYMENVSPERVFICAAGIKDHKSFIDLLEKKINKMILSSFYKKRTKSIFKGGLTVIPSDGEEVHCAIAFESVPWSNKDMVAFNVINTILGTSNSFSTGGPGKGMHSRTTKNCKLKQNSSASGINFHYSDSGIFGLKVSGDHHNRKELVNLVIAELKKLCLPLSSEELGRGKNILKSKIYLSLERQSDRLEEAVKNINSFGRLIFPHYKELIDAITSEKINDIARAILQTTPSIVLMGKELDGLSNLDEISRKLIT